jgi:hypothetical protein
LSRDSIIAIDFFSADAGCVAPPLNLIDLPGLDAHSSSEDSAVSTNVHTSAAA